MYMQANFLQNSHNCNLKCINKQIFMSPWIFSLHGLLNLSKFGDMGYIWIEYIYSHVYKGNDIAFYFCIDHGHLTLYIFIIIKKDTTYLIIYKVHIPGHHLVYI